MIFCFLAMDKFNDIIHPVFGITTMDGSKIVGIYGLNDTLDIREFKPSCTTVSTYYCRSSKEIIKALEDDEMKIDTFYGESQRTSNVPRYYPVPLKIALAAGLKPVNALQLMKENSEILVDFANGGLQSWLHCATTCCRGKQCSILGVTSIGLRSVYNIFYFLQELFLES